MEGHPALTIRLFNTMQIHWHEGLFLLPHHLQRLQRNAFERFGSERRLAWTYPYGIIESQLSRNDLENMRLRFDRLRAIMPSGLEVNFPDEAELPSREIKSALQERGTVTVSLAVPLWFPARTNCASPDESFDPRARILYRVVESEWADENTGGNAKPILERRINACLLLDSEVFHAQFAGTIDTPRSRRRGDNDIISVIG